MRRRDVLRLGAVGTGIFAVGGLARVAGTRVIFGAS